LTTTGMEGEEVMGREYKEKQGIIGACVPGI
jgi:hypothetical protein